MNILFRADSSSFIGTGHIMRDLVLVNEFKSDKIVFATQKLSGNINYKIEEAGYEIEILESSDFEELDCLIKKLYIDMIVIDYYGIDYKFEKKLKDLNPNLKIFIFDDTYEKHFCDILLNHNISADEKKYENLVPNNCELRCGSKYTLLRDEFLEAKKQKNRIKKDKKNKTVFIAMGGADYKNINIKILKIIKSLRIKENLKLKVNLVTTQANKNLEKLKDFCKNKKWIDLHINAKQIAKLMIKSDFAIVTPSVTANEVYYLELPFMAVKTASNQKDMYRYLKKKNFLVLKKFNSEIFLKFIYRMITDD